MVELNWTVEFETDCAKGSWIVIKPNNLKLIKLDENDIKSVKPAYFAIPGDLYEEPNVASPIHPCAGSIGLFVVGTDSIQRSIEEIFYYDYNVSQSHYSGKPHWNHETRFNDGQNVKKTNNVAYHQIPDSAWIRIMVKDPKGNIIKEKTINRIPPSKVRRKQ